MNIDLNTILNSVLACENFDFNDLNYYLFSPPAYIHDNDTDFIPNYSSQNNNVN